MIKPNDKRRRQLNRVFTPFAPPSQEEECNTTIIKHMISRMKTHSYEVSLLMLELDIRNAEETGAHHNTEVLQLPNLIDISSQKQRTSTDKDWGEHQITNIATTNCTTRFSNNGFNSIDRQWLSMTTSTNTVRHRMNNNDSKSRSTACASQHVTKQRDYQFSRSSIMSSRFKLSYAMMNKNEFYHVSSTLRTSLGERNNVVTDEKPAQDDRLMGRASKYCYIPGRRNTQNVCKLILSLIQISAKHTSTTAIAMITSLIVTCMVGELYLRKLYHPDIFLIASCPHYCKQIITILKSISRVLMGRIRL